MSSNFQFDNNAGPKDYTVNVKHSFKNDIRYFHTTKDTSKGLDVIHSHDFIQMWYVHRGTYRHFFGKGEFLLSKGSLLVVPPFCAHYIDTCVSDDSELYRCEFSEDFINDTPDSEQRNSLFDLAYLEPIFINANMLEPYHYFTGSEADKIEAIFEELCCEYSKHDLFSSMFIRANIIKLLALIAREFQATSTIEREKMFAQYRTAIQNSLDYINTHYTEKIYLKDVCKIALMSPRSFSYIFKQITGSTFTEYLLYLRVLRARDLLTTTNRTQYDISKACGFIDTSYFHRIFKKLTGCLPGQYRNLHLN